MTTYRVDARTKEAAEKIFRGAFEGDYGKYDELNGKESFEGEKIKKMPKTLEVSVEYDNAGDPETETEEV